jgi:hypothetical protein
MNSSSNPWAAIDAPSGNGLNVLRVDPASRQSFYWARKPDSRLALLLVLQQDPGPVGVLPLLRGIEVVWVPQQRQFQLVLEKLSDREIFYVLCQDLMHGAAAAFDDVLCMQAVLARLAKWQQLLSRGAPRVLADHEIRGLHAELLLLRDHAMPRYGALAVEFWRGPAGFTQDFAVDQVVIEVKAHLAGSAPEVPISSVDQLWVQAGVLYLWVEHLALSPDSGESLPQIIGSIRAGLDGNAAMLEMFESRLQDIGYLPFPAYEDIRYLAVDTQTFAVVPGFPRINPAQVPVGVVDLKYSIRLPQLAAFATVVNWPVVGVCQ